MKTLIMAISFLMCFSFNVSAKDCGLLKIPGQNGGINAMIRIDKINSVTREKNNWVSINKREIDLRFFPSSEATKFIIHITARVEKCLSKKD